MKKYLALAAVALFLLTRAPQRPNASDSPFLSTAGLSSGLLGGFFTMGLIVGLGFLALRLTKWALRSLLGLGRRGVGAVIARSAQVGKGTPTSTTDSTLGAATDNGWTAVDAAPITNAAPGAQADPNSAVVYDW